MILKKIVNQKEFDKLPQLDRIEFRQKEIKLDKEIQDLKIGGINFINHMFILIILLFISVFTLYNVDKDASLSMALVTIFIIKITLILGFLMIVYDIFIMGLGIKRSNKLKEEYFIIEIKPNKK